MKSMYNMNLVLFYNLLQVGQEIFHCLGDKVAVFLSYTNAGSSFVYNSLVDGKYLNPEAIRSYEWNETIISRDDIEKLAFVAEGLIDCKFVHKCLQKLFM